MKKITIVDGFKPEVDEILKGKLYLGNEEASQNLDILKLHQITDILVLGSRLKQNFKSDFNYLQFDIEDNQTQSIIEILDQTNEFIEKGKTVFVHCVAGINRSPAIVYAYLMQKFQWTLYQAYLHVKERRPKAQKQENFEKQLLKYEQQLFDN